MKTILVVALLAIAAVPQVTCIARSKIYRFQSFIMAYYSSQISCDPIADIDALIGSLGGTGLSDIITKLLEQVKELLSSITGDPSGNGSTEEVQKLLQSIVDAIKKVLDEVFKLLAVDGTPLPALLECIEGALTELLDAVVAILTKLLSAISDPTAVIDELTGEVGSLSDGPVCTPLHSISRCILLKLR